MSALKLSPVEKGLARSFLLMRVILYFFVLPLLRSIYPREPLPPYSAETNGLFALIWKNLFVFDAVQFGFVGANYQDHPDARLYSGGYYFE